VLASTRADTTGSARRLEGAYCAWLRAREVTMVQLRTLRNPEDPRMDDVIAPYPPAPMPPPRAPQSPEKTELPRRWPPPETPEAPAIDVPMPGVPDPSRPQPGL
jgi:hypothetical protein